jgi:hypothetical protein
VTVTTIRPDNSSNLAANFSVEVGGDDRTGLVLTSGEFVSIVAALAGVLFLFLCLVVKNN